MSIQRDNDEERVAIIERVLQEHRHQRVGEPVKLSTGHSRGSERREQPERRRSHSDAELRQQRAEWSVNGTKGTDTTNGEKRRENYSRGD